MAQQVEARLVNEYLWEHYKDKPQWKRVRLGQVNDKEQAALYSVTLRWVDAVVLDGEQLILIEAKVKPDLGAMGQLEEYSKLIRLTPEFSQYSSFPHKLIIVTTRADLNMMKSSVERGIEYVIYAPDWVIPYTL